jgi:hypothetical protein
MEGVAIQTTGSNSGVGGGTAFTAELTAKGERRTAL